ncbi:MAG: hypothetical protein GXO69_09625 [Acidobacteria bacterium]|nr:hypothetical protein [Acidobacteriota bacterium]
MRKIVETLLVILFSFAGGIAVHADSFTQLINTQYTVSGNQSTVFYFHGLKFVSPALGDFDGDGDLDLIVGNGDDYLTYFRNDGSATKLDPGAISPTIIKIPGETRLVPYPGDLDGDGDLDLVVGTASGKIYFVENTGVTNGMPDFVLDTTPIVTAISYCHPALNDADGDGDLDLFVGQGTAVAYYRNDGTATSPSFTLVQSNILSTTSINNLSPCFADIDGDGEAEMFCGQYNGQIAYYDKVVNGSTFSYNLVSSSYGGITVGEFSTCFFADTDNDSDLDIVCSDSGGKLRLYTSSGGTTPTYSLASDNFAYFDLGNNNSYKLIDMDGDGDLDMLATNGKVIAYFKNIGTDPANPNWELVTANLVSTTYDGLSLDTWDYDRDGDLDIIFGNSSGGIGLLENTGTASSPVFTEIYAGYRYTAESLFDGLKIEAPYSSIQMVDIDGDGDKDAIILSGWGTSAYYRNDDINLNQGGTDDTLDPWQPGNFVLIKHGASASSSYFPFGTGTNGRLAVWDLDGDGDPDFLSTNISSGISLFRNSGTPENASFSVETTNYAGINFDPEDANRPTVNIDMADLDGDGWPDLILGGASGGLEIYLNNAPDDTVAPDAPGNFTAVAVRDDRVKLQWDRVTDIGGTGVAKYVIKRDGVVVHEIPTPCPLTLIDTGLTQTTTYNYEITAVDRAGNESTAATASATTGLPPQLDHFNFIIPSGLENATFDVTVQAIDNYGYLFDSFNDTVTLTPSSGSISPTSVDLVNGQATVTLTFSDASATDEVTLTLTAENGSVSTPSGEIHLDIIPPDTPSLTQANPLDETDVQLVWSSVFDYGGSPSYYIDIYRNGTKIKTVDGSLISWTDNTVRSETTYSYKVQARDDAGNLSAFSNILQATTPAPANDETAPSIPQGLYKISAGTTSISIGWNPSTDTGGSGLYGYEVFRNGTQVGSVTTNYFSDSGLQESTDYTYFVRAVDNAGNRSNLSSGLTVTTAGGTADTTPPSTPTGLAGTVTSDTSVHLSWNASTDTGGSGLSGYQVFRNDYGSYTTVLKFVSAPTRVFDNDGLKPGTQYRYRIRAVDGAGNVSTYSNEVTVTTTNSAVDTEPPSIPTGLTGTAQSAQDIFLQWNPSTDNKGVASYEVYQNISGGPFGDSHYLLKTVAAPMVSTHITEDKDGNALTPATEYYFSVRAVDTSDNKSDFSAAATVTTPDVANDTTPPAPPANLHFAEVRSFHIVITFDAAVDNTGGSGIRQYHIYRNGSPVADISTTTYEDTDVTEDQSYSYYVVAEDFAGNLSDPTDTITTTVPVEDLVAPTTPSGLSADISSTEVTLNWNMSVDDGSGVDYYEIYRTYSSTPFKGKTTPIATTPFTSWADKTVTAGSSYQYKVRALDRAGNASSFSLLNVNVPEQSTTDNTIYFPHLVSDSMWWTGFALVNTSDSPANIGFEFYSATGEPVATLPAYTVLDAGQKLVFTIHDLFDGNVPAGAAWWRVTSDQPLNGFELFGTNDAEEMVGVKISKTPSSKLLFPAVKVDDTYWTGISLINTGDSDGTVTFYAYDKDGNELSGTKTWPLPAHGKIVDIAQNFFEDQSLPAGTAIIEVVSDRPCIGFELFGTHGDESQGISSGLAGLSAVPLNADSAFQQAPNINNKAVPGIKGGDTPNNLTAIVLNASSVELDWEVPDTGAPDTYQVWTATVSSTPFGDRVDLDTELGETTSTSYIAGGLQANTEYTFVVVGVTQGTQSTPSNSVTVTTPAESVPEVFAYMAPRLEELNGGVTELHMVNTSSENASVTLSSIDNSGKVVESTAVTIPGQGELAVNAGETFTITTQISGIRVESDRKLVAYEVFDNETSGYYDTLYMFSRGMNKIYFSHIAPQTDYWNSFIAIWNLSEYSNLVDLILHKPDGSILSTVSITIPAGAVSSGEIHDYVPDDDMVKQIGWIEAVGQYPVNGYLAFGPKNGKTLAAIEAE